ncbi:MAG: DUF484 family protein [Rhodobacteraceae bacterium]|nr:DUF484 family protein [Paracoccaceae bacterium]
MTEAYDKAGPLPSPESVRAAILDNPDIVLSDERVVQALADSEGKKSEGNLIDLRGVALRKQGFRLEELEATHRVFIAAARANSKMMERTHQAVIELMRCASAKEFLDKLDEFIPRRLGIDCIRLVVEIPPGLKSPLRRVGGNTVVICPPGSIRNYLQGQNSLPESGVLLRPIPRGDTEVYGAVGPRVQSEAVVRLRFKRHHFNALMLAGSTDAEQFDPEMETTLLEFFGKAVGCTLERFLA